MIQQTAQQIRDVRRFMKRIKIVDSGCWQFTGHIDKVTGYGRFFWEGRVNSAHRFSYQTFVGQIEGDNEVHHGCTNKWCVYPLHLIQVTWEEHRRLDGSPWRAACEARKAAITRCPKGHAYAEHGKWRNNYTGGRQRRCVECDRIYDRQRKARLKALRKARLKGENV